eukprot:TRINITY_DN21457_c0_g1_i1.p1 TRINITY_DN21457_c0_g1~~TRINITY_DN21457_c0_g1_i1.p1  ORF type:complete len:894 (+),score=60.33 TRINITY_DN21457_c0_g1_i1:53-2683(+)
MRTNNRSQSYLVPHEEGERQQCKGEYVNGRAKDEAALKYFLFEATKGTLEGVGDNEVYRESITDLAKRRSRGRIKLADSNERVYYSRAELPLAKQLMGPRGCQTPVLPTLPSRVCRKAVRQIEAPLPQQHLTTKRNPTVSETDPNSYLSQLTFLLRGSMQEGRPETPPIRHPVLSKDEIPGLLSLLETAREEQSTDLAEIEKKERILEKKTKKKRNRGPSMSSYKYAYLSARYLDGQTMYMLMAMRIQRVFRLFSAKRICRSRWRGATKYSFIGSLYASSYTSVPGILAVLRAGLDCRGYVELEAARLSFARSVLSRIFQAYQIRFVSLSRLHMDAERARVKAVGLLQIYSRCFLSRIAMVVRAVSRIQSVGRSYAYRRRVATQVIMFADRRPKVLCKATLFMAMAGSVPMPALLRTVPSVMSFVAMFQRMGRGLSCRSSLGTTRYTKPTEKLQALGRGYLSNTALCISQRFPVTVSMLPSCSGLLRMGPQFSSIVSLASAAEAMLPPVMLLTRVSTAYRSRKWLAGEMRSPGYGVGLLRFLGCELLHTAYHPDPPELVESLTTASRLVQRFLRGYTARLSMFKTHRGRVIQRAMLVNKAKSSASLKRHNVREHRRRTEELATTQEIVFATESVGRSVKTNWAKRCGAKRALSGQLFQHHNRLSEQFLQDLTNILTPHLGLALLSDTVNRPALTFLSAVGMVTGLGILTTELTPSISLLNETLMTYYTPPRVVPGLAILANPLKCPSLTFLASRGGVTGLGVLGLTVLNHALEACYAPCSVVFLQARVRARCRARVEAGRVASLALHAEDQERRFAANVLIKTAKGSRDRNKVSTLTVQVRRAAVKIQALLRGRAVRKATMTDLNDEIEALLLGRV